jgi:hypothetical protein
VEERAVSSMDCTSVRCSRSTSYGVSVFITVESELVAYITLNTIRSVSYVHYLGLGRDPDPRIGCKLVGFKLLNIFVELRLRQRLVVLLGTVGHVGQGLPAIFAKLV